MNRLQLLVLACVLLVSAHARALDVAVTPNAPRLHPYHVLELTFQHANQYAEPTWDVTLDLTFASPSGKAYRVGGFFYGSSKPPGKPEIVTGKNKKGVETERVGRWPLEVSDLWKARFAPGEVGIWKYTWSFTNPRGETANGTGTVEVVKGAVAAKGWLRISPDNPHRLVFENGELFDAVGMNGAPHHKPGDTSAMRGSESEGPFRIERGPVRDGAMFTPGPAMGPQSIDQFLGRHARAGFNLWRFSPDNATSIKLFADPNDEQLASRGHVRWEQAIMIDEAITNVRRYDMRIMYGLFGYMDVCAQDPKATPAELAKVKRLIKYSVDRWGAYVDIWELLNEQKVETDWYDVMIPYLKSIDPYEKPISTSWERSNVKGLDVCSPHIYKSESDVESDVLAAKWAAQYKKRGQLVVIGEQGNKIGEAKRELGNGGVWDPLSAQRLRQRLWTGFFNETYTVLWITSYAKDGHRMNIWVGPEERQYTHALHDFTRRLDAGVKMVSPKVTGDQVRGYGLRSATNAVAYLVHAGCAQCAKDGKDPLAEHAIARGNWFHDRGEAKDASVEIDVPVAAKGYWYDPASAKILKRIDVAAGKQTLVAPPFKVDIALLVTNGPAPDIDGDGIANDEDPDNDNDGVPDVDDAFPLEREETKDIDHDRIGDNLDADTDADGKADDLNHNNIPDNEEPDWDNDGVPNREDTFPRNPTETKDSDGDGIGDNADSDRDGDGVSNDAEKAAGTNADDPFSF